MHKLSKIQFFWKNLGNVRRFKIHLIIFLLVLFSLSFITYQTNIQNFNQVWSENPHSFEESVFFQADLNQSDYKNFYEISPEYKDIISESTFQYVDIVTNNFPFSTENLRIISLPQSMQVLQAKFPDLFSLTYQTNNKSSPFSNETKNIFYSLENQNANLSYYDLETPKNFSCNGTINYDFSELHSSVNLTGKLIPIINSTCRLSLSSVFRPENSGESNVLLFVDNDIFLTLFKNNLLIQAISLINITPEFQNFRNHKFLKNFFYFPGIIFSKSWSAHFYLDNGIHSIFQSQFSDKMSENTMLLTLLSIVIFVFLYFILKEDLNKDFDEDSESIRLLWTRGEKLLSKNAFIFNMIRNKNLLISFGLIFILYIFTSLCSSIFLLNEINSSGIWFFIKIYFLLSFFFIFTTFLAIRNLKSLISSVSENEEDINNRFQININRIIQNIWNKFFVRHFLVWKSLGILITITILSFLLTSINQSFIKQNISNYFSNFLHFFNFRILPIIFFAAFSYFITLPWLKLGSAFFQRLIQYYFIKLKTKKRKIIALLKFKNNSSLISKEVLIFILFFSFLSSYSEMQHNFIFQQSKISVGGDVRFIFSNPSPELITRVNNFFSNYSIEEAHLFYEYNLLELNSFSNITLFQESEFNQTALPDTKLNSSEIIINPQNLNLIKYEDLKLLIPNLTNPEILPKNINISSCKGPYSLLGCFSEIYDFSWCDALLEGNNSILSDLQPDKVHIMINFNNHSKAFQNQFIAQFMINFGLNRPQYYTPILLQTKIDSPIPLKELFYVCIVMGILLFLDIKFNFGAESKDFSNSFLQPLNLYGGDTRYLKKTNQKLKILTISIFFVFLSSIILFISWLAFHIIYLKSISLENLPISIVPLPVLSFLTLLGLWIINSLICVFKFK